MPRKERPEGTRAPNGASSIYLGKDGKWHGRVTVGVKDDGKPDRRHIERKTENEVIKAVRKLERDRDTGMIQPTGKDWTVERWLIHWFETIASPNIRYKTRAYYSTGIHKYAIPGLGAHKLTRLEPEHIEKLYARLRKQGASAATLQQVHIPLRAALNEAERRGRIQRNPIRSVRAPRIDESEIEPLSVDDAKAILALARERRNGVRWAIALALGLRQGEALGLKWSDIAIEWHHGCPDVEPCDEARSDECPKRHCTGLLTIRRALQRQTWQHGCDPERRCGRKRGTDCPDRHSGGLVITQPKSRAGRRVVSIPPPLVLALLDHREAQEMERQKAGDVWHDGGWVFAQPTGKPIDPRRDYGEWKEVLKAAGVREARLHDARHTAATMLLVLQTPTRAVMDVMGWSQVSMTKRYQHVPDAVRRNIASQLGGLLWQPPEDGDDGDGAAALVPA